MRRSNRCCHMRKQAMHRHLALWAIALLLASAADSQTPPMASVPADSPRWDLQGQAKATEYQGRKCLLLDSGTAASERFRDAGRHYRRRRHNIRKLRFFRFYVSDCRRRSQRRRGVSPPAQIRIPRRHAIYAGSEHRPELANLQWAGVHGRGGYPEKRLVSPAIGGSGRVGKLIRQELG